MASVNDIGVDLGTSRILIYERGKGIELSEPAVIAMDRDSGNIIAIGREAEAMIGRTPSNIWAFRPLRDGSSADYEVVCDMLRNFVSQVVKKSIFSKPRAILALPSAVNEMEKRRLISTMFDMGMRRTQIVNRSIAAAIGANLSMDEAVGTMVVDVSAGVVDIAVLSYGNVVVHDCVNMGGDRFDEAIIRHLRRKYNLLIGERTAEELKISIGSAIKRDNQVYMEVTGRSLITGLPKTLRIYCNDIVEAVEEPLQQLIDCVHGVLEHTPAELASDIFEYGILFTGGGAKLSGLCDVVSRALKVPCELTENPEQDIIIGCGRILENMQELGRFLDDGKKRRGRR